MPAQQEAAQGLYRAASDAAREAQLPGLDHVFLFPPVPMAVQRIANVERAQMLVEHASRRTAALSGRAWQGVLHAVRSDHKTVIRWLVDVDPQAI